MHMTEFMDHFINMFICQSNTFGTSNTGSLPYKPLILFRFHRIFSKLSDGIVIKSSHYIKRTVKDILSPDLYLDIPFIPVINIRTLQDLGHLSDFLLLFLIRILDADTEPGKSILLRNRKVRICKSHRIDQRIYNRSFFNKCADLFPGIHTVHYRNDHRILCNHIPDTFTYFCKRIIFYTDKNIILLSHFPD